MTAYDDSNALHLAIASDATSDIIQYLLEHGCKLNQQICRGPGWQRQMTRFAGFTPLMMAINADDWCKVKTFLSAGADCELYSSPISREFPIHVNNLLEVYEYEGVGFRFNALHIACCLNSELIVEELITHGHANVDARVDLPEDYHREYIGMNMDDNTTHPFEQGGRIMAALELGMNTALHLCDENSECALSLINDGNASLLTQNMSLDASWERHRDHLSEWLLSSRLNLEDTVVAVCKAKNLPNDCSVYITEFYVSLYLAEHYQRAYEQEMTLFCWPWMALSLTHRVDSERIEVEGEEEVATTWSIHREAINLALFGFRNRWREESETDEEPCDAYSSVREFVGKELKRVKMQKYKELFEVITTELYDLGLYDDDVYVGDEDGGEAKNEDDAMEEEEEEDDDGSVKADRKRKRI